MYSQAVDLDVIDMHAVSYPTTPQEFPHYSATLDCQVVWWIVGVHLTVFDFFFLDLPYLCSSVRQALSVCIAGAM